MPEAYYSVSNLEPNSSIGFLIRRCGVLMTQVAERRFASHTVSLTQWVTLMTLTKCEHMSATSLSAEVGHDMGALTRVVDDLERRGLVRRERSRRDRRAVEIAITPAGRRLAQSSKRVIVELLNELIEPLSAREIDTLIALLRRVVVRLQDAADSAAGAPDSRPAARARRKSNGRAAT
jgi:DNA-binding MarR family transcriptional regulator